MRVGQNPAKNIDKVIQPAGITVTVVNWIPFLTGYHEQSLDVLKACLTSLRSTSELPIDVMVFDNHSCREVRAYLSESYEQGLIQYLVLSDKNIGKIGAWNFMFGASQGEYVAFCDNDILFRPGWLSASIDLFKTYPNVGMVTGRPLRTPMQFSSASLDWTRRDTRVRLETGQLLDWDTYWEHVQSLGYQEEKARVEYPQGEDYRLTYDGKTAYIGAAHFQFLTRREVLQKIFPLASDKPMRGERAFDIAINDLGLLRLGTEQPLVVHLGNRLEAPILQPEQVSRRLSFSQRFARLPLVRLMLLNLYHRIFQLYFSNVE